ncbi:entry exclusion lipoprotein TrbK [Ralstonia pseudosolanacearum]|uniref:EexN family lipoprotein n=1 Tax=Ralstonia pseudosolanacearum TaxID=1310165 RepID=UPI000DAD4966|nr:EexN family lipoprotein [Ralstonia pseudosolanacearum]AZU56146.1 entry exclusion lipoprotein TrbK [Ralstonia solanacearum]MCK4136046.1 EexN family lipoprotein [Ralstonia pseudosolanacearum]QVX41876.1 EexN family lipoprotein [Ralstonia solanacearum]QWQ10897.1 EexN family lipoprotein [Ralstonia solanacearum]RAA14283.1 entry exclusion lipoprotein TrbK [Ralstonia pseudosolanacearum]
MKKIIPLLLAAMLVACGKSEPTATTSTPRPTDTVDSLAANPERLKELRQRCKIERSKLGDELCNRVAEATNRRFLGDGKTPYTPPKEQPKF